MTNKKTTLDKKNALSALGRVINQMSFVEQGLGSQASQTIDAVK